jgi:hypothetical protein
LIGVVGGNYVTLRRLSLESGMQAYRPHTPYDGVFNTSFPVGRMPSILSNIPVINKVLVTNKMTALNEMRYAGMEDHLPEMSTSRQYEAGWITKPYASQAGRGVERYMAGSTVRQGHYLQRDIVKFREFRAHVALWLGNPVFTIQEKKPKPELWERCLGNVEYEWPTTEEKRVRLPVTWNVESGFYFKRNTDPENRRDKVSRFPLLGRVEEVGIKAVKALGYQYGAVDILMNEDRELFVVEVNSHPAIKNERSVEIYKEILRPLSEMSREDLSRLVGNISAVTSTTFRRGHGFI